jgi:predicted nucleotidyltransferase
VNSTDGMTTLDPDFLDFIRSCIDRDVRFLIVGGYAVAAHGHPRYTKDLDVWVLVDQRNAERLLLALGDFGFGSLGLTTQDFLEEDVVVQLGYEPVRIDVLTAASGVVFADCYERRVEIDIEGVLVPFISLADLRLNKAATGRHRDLADLEALRMDDRG